MIADINVFDSATHVYDYWSGRVVERAVAEQPFWAVAETLPRGGLCGQDYTLRHTVRAPDEPAARMLAEEGRTWTGSVLEIARYHDAT
jgi:hypothetical protein